MTNLIKEFIKEAVESEFEGCQFTELADGFYLVAAKDEDGTTYIKIAQSIDDMQCDYDWDWSMPILTNGEVYDTESVILVDDPYLKSDSESFYNEFVEHYKEVLEELLKLEKAGDLENE